MQQTSFYMKKYGTSYYYATLFFPASIKDDVMTLYAFVRIPDLVVDVKDQDADSAKKELLKMWEEWEKAYSDRDVLHKTRWDAVRLFYRHDIPFALSRAFWDAMLLDTEKFRYNTYEELKTYMYGSAMVVGEMMCYVLGEHDDRALPYARTLGEAMQLTNFLRDVKEDYVDLGRIYMPLEDMKAFGLSHEDIERYMTTSEIDSSRREYMRFQISRADALYELALQWLQYLPRQTRNAIYLSAKLYQGILRKIEKCDYNIFAYSAKTTKRDKLRIVLSHMWKYFY